MTETSKPTSSTLRKRLTYGFLGLVILLAILVASLPFIAKKLLISTLEDQGAKQVTVEQLSLNPFTGRVALEGG